MNGDEQVGLHTAGFLHAHAKRHEIIVVARKHDAHARVGIDDGFEFFGDRQGHMLFVRAATANRARILAAVTWIENDHDAAFCVRGALLLSTGIADWRLVGRRCGGRIAASPVAFEQRHQRIRWRQRIEIEHDAVAVFANGL